MSLVRKLYDELSIHLSRAVAAISTVDDDKMPVTSSVAVGRAAGLEQAVQVFERIEANYFVKDTAIAINFDSLVSQLSSLDDDAPVRITIFAGLKSQKPLSNLHITMLDLRRMARIIESFKGATNG